jgi:hypothetical protein
VVHHKRAIWVNKAGICLFARLERVYHACEGGNSVPVDAEQVRKAMQDWRRDLREAKLRQLKEERQELWRERKRSGRSGSG